MTPTETLQENQRLAGLLARSLCEGGVRHVVVSPGSRSTPLALAFDSIADCALHVVLDERAAAFVALGIARASGTPAVVLATSGSAGANHFPAVVEANLGRVPLVSLTADRPTELQDCGAPQTMPQRALFGEHVRLALALPEPCPELTDRWIRNIGARAIDAATGGPAGPVQINVPFREPLFAPDAPSVEIPSLPMAQVMRGARRLSQAEIDRLAEALAREPSGAVVCGPLAPATVDAAAFAEAVTALARALDWPVLADASSGLRFGSHDRERVVSTADVLLRDAKLAEHLQVARVIRLGQPPTGKSVNRWLAAHADRVTLIDSDARWLDGGGVSNQVLAADPILLCQDLAKAIASREPSRTVTATRRWTALDRVAGSALETASTQGEWEGRVVRALAHGLSDGSRLHVASSMPIRDLDAFCLTSARRVAVTSNRGVNGIDGTIATALGIALASGEPTTVLLGDLAYLHDLDGLEAASLLATSERVSLTLVVVNNAGGGIFGELPIARNERAFERLFLTPRPADLGAVAAAFGFAVQRVPPSELDSAVARPATGVRVIEVVVSREESSHRRRDSFARAVELALAEVAT